MRHHIIPLDRGHAHLRGRAYSLLEEEVIPVDGIYLVSTISVNGREETVAFKRSGVGPGQIKEPYRVTTLTVTQPRECVQ